MPKQLLRKVKKDSKSRLEKFLGELESAVMDVVWEYGPTSVRQVMETLNQNGRHLAYTTIMTVMTRLKEKGWLTTEKEGRAYLYRTACTRQQAEAEAIGKVMRTLLQDFGEIAVAQFVRELDEIDPGQLNRLAELAQQAHDEKRNE